MKTILKICLLALPFGAIGQYTDYLGAGHYDGVTVVSSDYRASTSPSNSITGKGLDSPRFSAARFLSQATIGPSPEMVDELLESGSDYEAWIDEQFSVPQTSVQDEMHLIWEDIYDYRISQGEEDPFGPAKVHFDYAWWQVNMTTEDYLRHRMTLALAEILVVSDNSDLGGWGESLSNYYDILGENAFGNYRDLLEEVTYSIQMGYYLSHLNNAKENPEANTSPDENYAREIMQLFTIGLYELNQDGTRVLDGNGDPIATYDQDDIQEYAKVFTGLGIGELTNPDEWPYQPFFGLNLWAAKKDAPMTMYQDFHETAPKTLLGGDVLPANQTGDQDIQDAIDNLFNHPNVGPFIGTLLIKRLVKSNPSPEYIARVSAAFADNGSGVRGDMKAITKAILLDPEARDGASMLTEDAGRVREPMMKFTAMARAMELIVPTGQYWTQNFGIRDATLHSIFSSPTVFNYYLPNFEPVGDLSDVGLAAPEMKLHNTSSAINYINGIYALNFWGQGDGYEGQPNFLGSWEDQQLQPYTRWNQLEFLQYADQPEILVNELDKLLTYGQLSEQTRNNIISTLHDSEWSWNDDWRLFRVQSAIYYIMISPDFNIIK